MNLTWAVIAFSGFFAIYHSQSVIRRYNLRSSETSLNNCKTNPTANQQPFKTKLNNCKTNQTANQQPFRTNLNKCKTNPTANQQQLKR
jgi:hypothetical protein